MLKLLKITDRCKDIVHRQLQYVPYILDQLEIKYIPTNYYPHFLDTTNNNERSTKAPN